MATYAVVALGCSGAASRESLLVARQTQAVAVGDGRTRGAMEEALGGSGAGGRGEVAGMERRLVVVAVVLVGMEQTPCSGCRAASQLARVASLGMAIVVRIVGGMLLGVVLLAHMPMPWESWSWRERAARSCSTLGTCP